MLRATYGSDAFPQLPDADTSTSAPAHAVPCSVTVREETYAPQDVTGESIPVGGG